MKKYINLALYYSIFAMMAGVFYREFTKFHVFSDTTALGKVHTHLFLLGMVMFILVSLLDNNFEISRQKYFQGFMWLYNIGLHITAVMMLIRGTIQVLRVEIVSSLNGAISGMAGIGHILLSVGIILLLLSLRKAVDEKSRK